MSDASLRYFGVYSQLCELRLPNTAATMIEDLTRTLVSFEDGGCTLEDMTPSDVDDCVAGLRETLMLMLSDPDGSQLTQWLCAYRSDISQFRNNAVHVSIIWCERLNGGDLGSE